MTPAELRARIDRGETPPLSPDTYAAADALARAARSESVYRMLGSAVTTRRRRRGGTLAATGLAIALITAGALWISVPTPL